MAEWTDAAGLPIAVAGELARASDFNAFRGNLLNIGGGVRTLSPTSGTVTLDGDAGSGGATHVLSGNVTYQTANLFAGYNLHVRISTDTSRTVTWPAGWLWLTDEPSSIVANTAHLLSIYCYGTANTDVVAAVIVEP